MVLIKIIDSGNLLLTNCTNYIDGTDSINSIFNMPCGDRPGNSYLQRKR